MDAPKVSVIIPSYNHAMFIGQAIESVLNQDFRDFELLIADDFSTDNSRDIIDSYIDTRIKKFYFDSNRGAIFTHNFLVQESQTNYIALLNSDDFWLPSKLNKQYCFMEDHPEIAACFTWANMVDEEGNDIDDKIRYSDVFRQNNRSSGRWLEHFFYEGNCLCHPSILIRKEIYNELGGYRYAYRQLPDFEMWIRIVKRYPIYILCENLVSFRKLDKTGQNTSAETEDNAIRGINELYSILLNFFDNMDDELFREGFSKYFRNKNATKHDELSCERAFILLDGNWYLGKAACQVVAINKLSVLLDSDATRNTLLDVYNFSDKDYFALTGSTGLGSLAYSVAIKQRPLFNMVLRLLKNNKTVFQLVKKHYYTIKKIGK